MRLQVKPICVRRIVGLALRTAAAIVITATSFCVCVLPSATDLLGLKTCSYIYHILDLPVSLFNWLLPVNQQSPIALQFAGGAEIHGPLSALASHYIAVGVVPWLCLLYLPNGVRYVFKKHYKRARA